MTNPTPGRVLHFFPSINDGIARNGAAPLAALIVAVLGDRLVNLAVFDANGNSHARTDVQLIQDDTDVYVTDAARAEWPVQRALQELAAATSQLLKRDESPVILGQSWIPGDQSMYVVNGGDHVVSADEKAQVVAIADAPFNVGDAFKDAGLVELNGSDAPVEANETPVPVETTATGAAAAE